MTAEKVKFDFFVKFDLTSVFLSTVSRALQDHARFGFVSKMRIQVLAKEMGFVPSAIARGLKTNR